MIRTRAERRRRVRLEAKELRAVRRELADRGLAARAAAASRAVAPGAAFFWHTLKARIAARESLRPIQSLDTVRDMALQILAEQGVDMDGLVLKVEWQPPVMWIEAIPAHEHAVAAVEAVRARAG